MIQTLRFRLRPDVDLEAFLEADRRVQANFAYQRPGLMRRTTARSEDGEWIVIDLWRTADDADAADRLWEHDATVRQFMGFVDEASVRSTRYLERDWMGSPRDRPGQ